MSRIVLAVLACACLDASVVSVDVAERSDLAAGREFGKAGQYEIIQAKVRFAVDPKLETNAVISDIALPPRNARGLVEFSADLYLTRPKEPERANGTVLFEVPNRGNRGMQMFNFDNLLLNQGYTLAWLGWQFDLPSQPGLLRLYAPIARREAQAIRGLVRSEFVPDRKVLSFSLADRTMVPYPAVNPETATMTVRDTVEGERRVISRASWRFAQHKDGVVQPSRLHAYTAAGFEPGKIYEVVYEAADPPVAGLALAAIRDAISFLKYGAPPGRAVPSPDLKHGIKRAIAFGSSQSGRFLRTFLYRGFNADERGLKVFDGVISHVAGAGLGSFNHRFAQPSRDAAPFMNLFYPVDLFPFSDQVQTDPETKISDGLLAHAQRERVIPKIFYTLSSYEYYGRAASLMHTSVDGERDLPLAANTRIYMFSGCQHGPAAFPPARTNGLNLPSPAEYRWGMRALLVAMNRWVTDGRLPPPSRYPTIADGSLVPLASMQFPKIPGVPLPTRIHKAYRVDYGPRFRGAGIITLEPPAVGNAFPILVPQVDADGNDTAGIRMPEISVPLGTYTGWNLRDPRIGAPEELLSLAGSFIPFASTEATRGEDPRPAVLQRYQSMDEYMQNVTKAARAMVSAGYVLDRDVPPILRRARETWEFVMGKEVAR